MRRSWKFGLLIALCATAGVNTACSTPVPFGCEQDDHCRLDGQPGICTEAGHCAYLDPSCSTGWSYPVGVAGALGGTCAPGVPPTGSSTGQTSDPGSDTVDPTSASGPPPDQTTEPETASDPTIDPDESDSESGAETTEGMCPDQQANDQPFEHAPFFMPQCTGDATDELDEGLSPDWFQFISGNDGCGFLGVVTTIVDLPSDLCVFHLCGSDAEAVCGEGSIPTQFEEFTGCCRTDFGPETVVTMQNVRCDEGLEFLVRVASPDGAFECSPYQVVITAT